jgi:hypothetical protein
LHKEYLDVLENRNSGYEGDIVEAKSFCQDDKFQEFSSQGEAARFLEGFSSHWRNFDRMLAALRAAGEAANMRSHQEVATQLARLVFADRLRLRKSHSAEDKAFRGPFGMKLGTWIERNPIQLPKTSTTAPTAPANDWIKVKVVDDQSGEVIPKVNLV